MIVISQQGVSEIVLNSVRNVKTALTKRKQTRPEMSEMDRKEAYVCGVGHPSSNLQ